MSNLDDLDEYEAELELGLRKEYQAVFGLFRYCILTPDATYLCNRLERTVVPQQAYPFINLRLEDVWVWDKNRPDADDPADRDHRRLRRRDDRGAPRRGDEPTLTAEDLAEKLGQPRREDDF